MTTLIAVRMGKIFGTWKWEKTMKEKNRRLKMYTKSTDYFPIKTAGCLKQESRCVWM